MLQRFTVVLHLLLNQRETDQKKNSQKWINRGLNILTSYMGQAQTTLDPTFPIKQLDSVFQLEMCL